MIFPMRSPKLLSLQSPLGRNYRLKLMRKELLMSVWLMRVSKNLFWLQGVTSWWDYGIMRAIKGEFWGKEPNKIRVGCIELIRNGRTRNWLSSEKYHKISIGLLMSTSLRKDWQSFHSPKSKSWRKSIMIKFTKIWNKLMDTCPKHRLSGKPTKKPRGDTESSKICEFYDFCFLINTKSNRFKIKWFKTR